MAVKGVLFDLDGTLLDRDTSLLSFVRDQYDRITDLHGIDKELYVTRFVQLDQRGYVWKDKVYQQLIQEFNLSLSWQELLEDYINGFGRHCIGFPHLYEMLQALKSLKIKLGMITNGYGTFQLNNIHALGIHEYFDVILISEVEGLRKPDPAIFERALTRLGLAPHEVVFVGDHPVHDVAASRAVGMKGLWKADPQITEPVECDAVIRDLLDICSFVEQKQLRV